MTPNDGQARAEGRDLLDLVVRDARIAADSAPRSIAVRAGVIVAIADRHEDLGPALTTVDAEGRWVIPGAIDTHSHINQRAPEYEHLEGLRQSDNFAAETRGALAGGCTTALNYIQFGPDSMMESFHAGMSAARAQSMVNVLFHGTVMSLEQADEIPAAVREGIRSFKIFMPYRGEEARNLGGIRSLNHAQMRIAFAQIARHNGQALVHAEDGDIVDHCMAEEAARGLDSLSGWDRSRPTIAEGDAAWTAMYLAEEAGCPVTIVHVSSLEAMRARRALAYPRAALESCPHYMVLNTSSDIGPEGKVAPPLRDPELAAQITEAVLRGEIDFFGSDHNVWPRAAKRNWDDAKPGLPGIGLLLPLLLTHLVHDRGMSMQRLVELTSRNAALRFGLPGKGLVEVGADADLVILDEGERVVRAEELHTAVDFSPYSGVTLRMWPHATICGGVLAYDDGKFPAPDFRGEMLNDRFADRR
jgi:dihydroorotase-like cyclic amidohydrolase